VVKWYGLSPEERYGAIDWQGFTTRYLTYETAIVDMQAAKVVRTLPEWQLHALDDTGTALVKPWAEGGGDTMWMFPLSGPKKMLFTEIMLDWDAKSRRAILELPPYRTKRKLGKAACKLVRVTKTP
jgi:hypothetical protein